MKRIWLGRRKEEDSGQVEPPPADKAPADTLPAPSTSRSRLARPFLRSRRARVAAGLGAAGLVVVLVAVIAGGAFGRRSPSPQPTASPEGTATGTPESTASYTPFPRHTYNDTPEPSESLDPWYEEEPTLVANGWPVEVEEYYGSVLVGPDGTIYIDGYDPLSPAGRFRADWVGYPSRSYAEAAAFGSDGTIYAYGNGDADNGRLWALDPNGKVRAGWPVTVSAQSFILPGPSGTVYALSLEAPNISLFGADGKPRARVKVPGLGPEGEWYPSPFCDQLVTPEGLLYVAVPPDCKIRVYGPTGTELTQGASGAWESFVMAQDGAVVAWGRDWEPAGHGIARTRLALLGPDGQPLPGWPVIFEGAAYKPVFAPDGTMYVTVLGLGRASSRIEALGRDGASRPGWPVAYPTGYGPLMDAESPIVGAGGSIHVAAVNGTGLGYVLGIDPSGRVVPGWPYQLPRPFAEFVDLRMSMAGPGWLPNPTPLFVPSAGGGLLYLALDDRIVALDGSGKMAPGWPYKPRAAGVSWSIVTGTPAGGIVIVLSVIDAEGAGGAPLVRCLTAAGGTPK